MNYSRTSIVFFAFCLVLQASNMISAQTASDAIKTDAIKTRHLASEVADAQFQLSIDREVPFRLGVVDKGDVFLSCHCIKLVSECDVNGNYLINGTQIPIQLTFSKAIESTNQKVIIAIDDRQIQTAWNAIVVKDINVEKSILRFNEDSQAEQLMITCASRDKFQETELPHVVFDESKIKSVDLKLVEQNKKGDFFVAKFQCSIKATEEMAKQVGNSLIEILHPNLVLAPKKNDQQAVGPRYQKYTLPVYFNEDSKIEIVVNFGALKAGNSRVRTLPFSEFGDCNFTSLVKSMENPFSVQQLNGKEQLEFKFHPKKPGRWDLCIPFTFSNEKSGELRVKGFAYGKITNN